MGRYNTPKKMYPQTTVSRQTCKAAVIRTPYDLRNITITLYTLVHSRVSESFSFPLGVDFLYGLRVRLCVDINAYNFGGHVGELHRQTFSYSVSCACDLFI